MLTASLSSSDPAPSLSLNLFSTLYIYIFSFLPLFSVHGDMTLSIMWSGVVVGLVLSAVPSIAVPTCQSAFFSDWVPREGVQVIGAYVSAT